MSSSSDPGSRWKSQHTELLLLARVAWGLLAPEAARVAVPRRDQHAHGDVLTVDAPPLALWRQRFAVFGPCRAVHACATFTGSSSRCFTHSCSATAATSLLMYSSRRRPASVWKAPSHSSFVRDFRSRFGHRPPPTLAPYVAADSGATGGLAGTPGRFVLPEQASMTPICAREGVVSLDTFVPGLTLTSFVARPSGDLCPAELQLAGG